MCTMSKSVRELYHLSEGYRSIILCTEAIAEMNDLGVRILG